MSLASFFNFDYYYQIYLDKCMLLAKSIVVKSNYIVLQMNESVKSRNVTVEDHNPKTWKYYLNVSGQYHPFDKRMYVKSVDTQETIEFNLDNLSQHRATKKAYQIGTVLYDELLSRYPNQEILILGILYPCDIEKAIKAKDGEILAYPKELVEENEYSFMKDLQDWIYGYKYKREAPVYGFSDELWPIANLGIFYLFMLLAILNIRKSKCKTNEAHSYHVRRYLASHGFLDDYMDVMTLKQSLRFYMNINWIERNLGKREVQTWLINEVMTARNLPIAEYSLKHDFTDQLKDIYPVNFFKKKSINGLEKTTPADNLSLSQLLIKEDPLAKGNPASRRDFEKSINRQLQNSLSNTLNTKVLESKIVDFSDADDEKLSNTLINLWCDWSVKGIFRSSIYFTDHLTGNRLSLSAKDAFILYIYAYYRTFGYDFKVIPDVKVTAVPILDFISEDDIYSVVDRKTPHHQVESEFVKYLLDNKTNRTTIISISEFFDTAKQVNKALNNALQLALYEEHYMIRGYKEAMVYRLYSDHWVELADKDSNGHHKSYQSFFRENQLNFSNYERDDWSKLYKTLYQEATGVNLNNSGTLRSVHRAMLSLLKQLSSYSVQYLEESREDEIFMLEMTPPKVGDVSTESQSIIFFESPVPEIMDYDSGGSEVYNADVIVSLDEEISIHQQAEASIEINDNIDVNVEESLEYFYFIENDIDVFVDYELKADNNPDDLIDVPGINSFNKLSIEQKSKIRDFYGHDFRWLDPCKTRTQLNLISPGDGFLYDTTPYLFIKSNNKGFKYTTP